MQYSIILNEEDFLARALFIASKSQQVKKNRRKSTIYTAICLFLLGFIFSDISAGSFSIAYFISGIACLILMPYYLKYTYRKHYLKHIRETYTSNYGMSAEISLSGDTITASELNVESKIKTSEVSEVNETSDYFFMRLKSNQSIVIPKRDIDTTKFMEDMLQIQKSHDFKIVPELDWKWK